jgi:hypothetical protein
LDLMTLLLDMLHLRMIDGIPFVGYMAWALHLIVRQFPWKNLSAAAWCGSTVCLVASSAAVLPSFFLSCQHIDHLTFCWPVLSFDRHPCMSSKNFMIVLRKYYLSYGLIW